MTTSASWPLDAGTSTLVELDKQLREFFFNQVQVDDLARELTQETWLAGRLFRKESSLRTYLFAVARRRLADFRRKKHRRRDQPPVVDVQLEARFGPRRETSLQTRVTHQQVREAIDQVPEPFASVLRLSLSGQTDREIAGLLDLNPNTVRSRLSRGRAHVMALLLDDETHESTEPEGL